MAKKTATYADYELRVEDNGKIVILNAGQAVQNAMGAIRTIASEVGFALDPKWNTQSSGRKLVDFINSSTPATASTSKPEATDVAAKTEPKQAPTPTQKPEINKVTVAKSEPKQAPASTEKPNDKPIKSNTESTDIELTEEEMKQLDDILKRLDSLEARIAKLEKAPAVAQDNKSSLYVVSKFSDIQIKKRNPDGSLVIASGEYISNKAKREEVYGKILQGNYSSFESINFYGSYIMLLSNGEFIKHRGGIGNSIKETKAFALEMEVEVPEKATATSLAASIMAKYGRNGWCVGKGLLLDGNGWVHPYSVIDFTSYINEFVGRAGLAKQLPVPDLTGKTGEEKLRIVSDYISQLSIYPLPPKEKVIEDFKKACEEYDKFGK